MFNITYRPNKAFLKIKVFVFAYMFLFTCRTNRTFLKIKVFVPTPWLVRAFGRRGKLVEPIFPATGADNLVNKEHFLPNLKMPLLKIKRNFKKMFN